MLCRSKSFLVAALVSLSVSLMFSSTNAQIIIANEDFSTGVGLVTGGNAGANFSASGGVGILNGNGVDTFISIGIADVMFPELAMGGELTFQVDNLGGAANPVTTWLQLDVDNVNTGGRNFVSTGNPLLMNHSNDDADADGFAGTTTIPVGTTELDLLLVTTVDFGGSALPAAEIARVGSFFAEFTPVPEPASAALLGLGCLSLLGLRQRR